MIQTSLFVCSFGPFKFNFAFRSPIHSFFALDPSKWKSKPRIPSAEPQEAPEAPQWLLVFAKDGLFFYASWLFVA